MPEFTLVVVDMQLGFRTALEELTILGCQEQIKIAMKHNNPIVFVEYNGYRETLPELSMLVKDYENKFTVFKNSDNGFYEVKDVVFKNNLSEKIRICGVNADCCVWHTAKHLSEHYKVKLVATASNSCHGIGRLSCVFNRYKKDLKIPILFQTTMMRRIEQKLAA